MKQRASTLWSGNRNFWGFTPRGSRQNIYENKINPFKQVQRVNIESTAIKNAYSEIIEIEKPEEKT